MVPKVSGHLNTSLIGKEKTDTLGRIYTEWNQTPVFTSECALGGGSEHTRTFPNLWELLTVRTKSSPESAPADVMDSLLVERGKRPERGGATAASSANFFFSLVNILRDRDSNGGGG